MDHVIYTQRDDIAIATVNHPPVNTLSLGVREGLMEAITRAMAAPEIKALVITGSENAFVAGADINDFGKPYAAPTLYAIIDALRACAKPVFAAIQGAALGGGMELALHCHWRVARADALLGQPEIKLGLMPGGGGIPWWTRLAGPEAAVQIATTGEPVTAADAHTMGVVDHLIDGDFLPGTLAFVRKVLAGGPWNRHLEQRDDKIRNVNPQLFAALRAKNARRWQNQIAPWKIVDCVEAACRLDFTEAYALEKAAFQECERSPQSAALIHVFFAERKARRIDGITPEVSVASVAVIGAGTMGRGIAMAFADAGIPVTLVDMSDKAVSHGLDAIGKTYAASVSRGSLAQHAADTARTLIRGSSTYADIAAVDVVIEAVFEDMAVKQDVFHKVAAVVRPDTLIATNTSMLDIDVLAAAVPQPERVLGLHFFSPANVMKLLEIVPGARTSPQVIATALAVAKVIRKIAVVAGNAEGFIGNRIMAAYGREADILLAQGATPWQIDQAMVGFGFAMGLYAVRDLAGLDVIWRVRQHQAKADPVDIIADRIHALGRYGQKTGAGYYRYDGRTANPDPDIEALIGAVSAERGIERRPIDSAEILRRILGAMADEGGRILAAGVAQRASDIDVVYVHGYGFPAYRGGPMFYAQQQADQERRDHA